MFGSDCVTIIFSLTTCFPSLTRPSQMGSQADNIRQYLGVGAINSVVFFSTAVQLITPVTALIASARQYSSVPVQVGRNSLSVTNLQIQQSFVSEYNQYASLQ